MMYLFDLLFVIGYLFLKRFFKTLQDVPTKVEGEVTIWKGIRKEAIWVEYTYIVLCMYLMPSHNFSEGMVSFCMCMLTKVFFDLMVNCYRSKKGRNAKNIN